MPKIVRPDGLKGAMIPASMLPKPAQHLPKRSNPRQMGRRLTDKESREVIYTDADYANEWRVILHKMFRNEK